MWSRKFSNCKVAENKIEWFEFSSSFISFSNSVDDNRCQFLTFLCCCRFVGMMFYWFAWKPTQHVDCIRRNDSVQLNSPIRHDFVFRRYLFINVCLVNQFSIGQCEVIASRSADFCLVFDLENGKVPLNYVYNVSLLPEIQEMRSHAYRIFGRKFMNRFLIQRHLISCL